MPEKFALRNFDGPLDLLLLLVQKDEIEIVEIAIHLLTQQLLTQFKAEEMNRQADQMSLLAQLLLLKSRRLMPSSEEKIRPLLDEEERHTLMEQLLEHASFKDLIEALQEKERQSHAHFTRLLSPIEEKENPPSLGLSDITLDELKRLFTKIYANAKPGSQEYNIKGEKWEIREKIALLFSLLAQQKELSFGMLFEKTSCKEELIVTFLALLELIKQGNILVTLDNDQELKFTGQ